MIRPVRAWNSFFFRPTSARPLGAIRILFGLLALANLAFSAVDLDYWYTDAGLLRGDEARNVAGPLQLSPLHYLQDPASVRVAFAFTATAAALPALRERMLQTTLGVDVLGVVQPGAVQAVAATRNGRIGVMATPATVQSGAYPAAIAKADPFVDVTSIACPDLTRIIESGFPFDQRVVDTVRDYCAPLREAGAPVTSEPDVPAAPKA